VLRLLLDEDIKSRQLVRLLTEAGHDVQTTTDLGIDGTSDETVLARATNETRTVLAYNCSDFRALHEAAPTHAGILVVYREPGKELSRPDIVRALSNLERAGVQFADTFHAVNHWKY